MKRWYQSKINWTQVASVLLSLVPFILSYLELLELSAQDKAFWVLAVNAASAGLTAWLRNYKTDTAIGSAEDVAAHQVLTRAFDDRNSGA